MNVLLMGLRGSGKTEVGKRLAALLGRPFVDLDHVVLASFTEGSVGEVWAARGEQAWREAEGRSLVEVMRTPGQVIALGGGTPMVPAARAAIESGRLAGGATVVYLSCTAAELAGRLARDTGDRPSLTGADPSREVEQVLARRQDTFRQLADHVIEVTHATPAEAAEAILRSLES